MKKISTIFLLIITLVGYGQMPQTIVASVKQDVLVKSSDWIAIDHSLGLNDPDPFLSSGFTKINKGDLKGAIQDLTMALDNSKNHHEFIFFFRGLAKHKLGDYSGASIDFTRCLLTNSRMADAYFRRGLSKYEMGNYESACNDFAKTLQPTKALYTTKSDKVHEVINQFCNDVQIDTLMIESLAKIK